MWSYESLENDQGQCQLQQCCWVDDNNNNDNNNNNNDNNNYYDNSEDYLSMNKFY